MTIKGDIITTMLCASRTQQYAAQPDARAQAVLSSLVREYMERGEPVGSRTLARISDMNLSAATMRNVMADLEIGGFLISPHTSAGRVPSARGIRFFVDRLLTAVAPPACVKRIKGGVGGDTMRDVLFSAARTVSELTRFAGFVVAPPRAPAVKSLRFVRLSPGRALAVIVTPDGEILNRILQCHRALSEREMRAAAMFYNRRMSGLTFAEAEVFLRRKVKDLRGEIADLLRQMLEMTSGEENDDNVRVAGELNLLEQTDLSADLDRLRKLHRLLRRKTGILHLIDKSRRADNVCVFIGSECENEALADCSVVLSPVGSASAAGFVGVIGPKRMKYQQVIATVRLASATVAETWQQMRAEIGGD